MLKPLKGATSKALQAEPLSTKVALRGCNSAGCGYRLRGLGLVFFCVWGLEPFTGIPRVVHFLHVLNPEP